MAAIRNIGLTFNYIRIIEFVDPQVYDLFRLQFTIEDTKPIRILSTGPVGSIESVREVVTPGSKSQNNNDHKTETNSERKGNAYTPSYQSSNEGYDLTNSQSSYQSGQRSTSYAQP